MSVNDTKASLSIEQSRKRASSSPLNNSSKRKQKFQEEEENEEEREALLVNLSLGTRTRTMDDIEKEIKEEVESLSVVMKMPSDATELMLCQLSWNKDTLLQV